MSVFKQIVHNHLVLLIPRLADSIPQFLWMKPLNLLLDESLLLDARPPFLSNFLLLSPNILMLQPTSLMLQYGWMFIYRGLRKKHCDLTGTMIRKGIPSNSRV